MPQVTPLLAAVLDVALPDAGFYLWAAIPEVLQGHLTPRFARELLAQYNVTVLPGSYLARDAQGHNPGAGRVRMALVAETAECVEAAQRIVQFIQSRTLTEKPNHHDSRQLQAIIDAAWENRANLSAASAPKEVLDAVEHVIAELNNGTLRVATREGVGQWTTHQWIKKAVLLSFRLKDNELMRAGDLGFYDKVPTKFAHLSEAGNRATGVRVVPPAVARRGSFIAKGAILMPSYVNIGAYVDEGTMVDTWATVGSCAQIGKNVHLSRRRGHRRRAGADAGQPDHHRRQLLHRRALRSRRRRDRRGKLGDLHGRVHRPEHPDLRPRHRRP